VTSLPEWQAIASVSTAAVVIVGALLGISSRLRRGENADMKAADAVRHQLTDDRLSKIEADLSGLQTAQKEQDKRIASIERTMATREDITETRKELSSKIDSVKNEIIAEIARLMAPRRRR
jgi:hypothetical protein